MGRCDVEEGGRRIRSVFEFLESRGFDTSELLFCVDDPSDGRLFAALTAEVRELRFKALVARFSSAALRHQSERIFENLEFCRDVLPRFKIDITVMEDTFAFVDQP